MGIKDVLKKATKRVKKELTNAEEEALGTGPEDLSLEEDFIEEPLEASLEETPAPTPKESLEPAEPQEPEEAVPDTDQIKQELDRIKSKLEELEAHLKTIESQAVYQKGDIQNFLQYLTLINDKLDQLEQEHSEIESIMKQKSL